MAEIPRYRLTQKAYMAPRPWDMEQILPADTEVEFAGPPGEHMEPLNDAAREMVAQSPARSIRPELSLPMQSGQGSEAGAMARQAMGVDMTIDANVIGLVAQLAVRMQMLEAQVAELRAGPQVAKVLAPPPTAPPLPRRATA